MTRGALVAAVAVAVAAVGCGDDGSSPMNASSPALIESLCAARDTATAGDADEARTIFVDQVHDELHQLAADTDDADRDAAARLLEAKQRVEADLTDRTALADALEALAAATIDAIEANGDPRPDPCPT